MPELESQGGTPTIASATPVEQGAVSTPSAVEQFAVGTSESSATPQAQGEAVVSTPNYEEQLRNLQSQKDQAYAQFLAVQQQAQLQQQQINELLNRVQMPQNADPPPDPNQDWAGYMKWELRQMKKDLVSEVRQANEQWINGIMTTAQERQFEQSHPDIPLQTVKQFAQMRGVQNLEDAYLLMTYNRTIGEVQQKTAQQAVSSFKQPQQSQMPVRVSPQSPQPQEQVYDADKMIREIAKDPSLVNKLPPQILEGLQHQMAMMMEHG